jgi:hypothetical protein
MRWGFKTARTKVAHFRRGPTRHSDDQFVIVCELPVPDDPPSNRIVVGVRRTLASVGLIDPQFLRANHQFPEELGGLPLWDSMDRVSHLLALEEATGETPAQPLKDWPRKGSFSVKQLVGAALIYRT